MAEKTTLVDCMEEHGIEQSHGDSYVAHCPYQEIAEELLAALEYTTAFMSGSLHHLPDRTRASAKIQVQAARATIAQATVYSKVVS